MNRCGCPVLWPLTPLFAKLSLQQLRSSQLEGRAPALQGKLGSREKQDLQRLNKQMFLVSWQGRRQRWGRVWAPAWSPPPPHQPMARGSMGAGWVMSLFCLYLCRGGEGLHLHGCDGWGCAEQGPAEQRCAVHEQGWQRCSGAFMQPNAAAFPISPSLQESNKTSPHVTKSISSLLIWVS